MALGKSELAHIGLVDADAVETGYVVRTPKAYPVYDGTYEANVLVMRKWLEEHTTNVLSRRSQRHAQVQQPGPLDVHRNAERREHPR